MEEGSAEALVESVRVAHDTFLTMGHQLNEIRLKLTPLLMVVEDWERQNFDRSRPQSADEFENSADEEDNQDNRPQTGQYDYLYDELEELKEQATASASVVAQRGRRGEKYFLSAAINGENNSDDEDQEGEEKEMENGVEEAYDDRDRLWRFQVDETRMQQERLILQQCDQMKEMKEVCAILWQKNAQLQQAVKRYQDQLDVLAGRVQSLEEDNFRKDQSAMQLQLEVQLKQKELNEQQRMAAGVNTGGGGGGGAKELNYMKKMKEIEEREKEMEHKLKEMREELGMYKRQFDTQLKAEIQEFHHKALVREREHKSQLDAVNKEAEQYRLECEKLKIEIARMKNAKAHEEKKAQVAEKRGPPSALVEFTRQSPARGSPGTATPTRKSAPRPNGGSPKQLFI